MKVSKLIKQLKKYKKIFGDKEVFVNGESFSKNNIIQDWNGFQFLESMEMFEDLEDNQNH